MIKVYIIIGVIFLLSGLIIYLLFNNYNIEKFTSNEPPISTLTPSQIQKLRNTQLTQLYSERDISTITPTIRPTIRPTQAPTPTPTQAPTQAPIPAPALAPTIEQEPNTDYKKADFWAVMSIYEPWGIYYAGNVVDNKLKDLSKNTTNINRDAFITGNFINKIESGNGAYGTIKSIFGTTLTTIEWPANSISDKFTICSITRYVDNNNNKRILTAKDANQSNDWIHGHKNGKRGVVYYNDFKTDSSPILNLTGNNTDWVVTCAKNDANIPNNVYINNVPSGIKPGGQGNLKLSINKIDDNNIINEQSDFALSYVIIWNRHLTDIALSIVSESLMNYLNTGEDLIFNIDNLSTDDKVKVFASSQKLITTEITEMQNANEKLLLKTTSDATADTQAIAPDATTTPDATNTSSIENDKLKLYAQLAKYEKLLTDAKDEKPSATIIDLIKPSNDTCISFPTMPQPIEDSFTSMFDYKNLANPIIQNSKDSTYIWCNKCDAKKSDECDNYNICYNFYNDNKDNFTEEYFNKSKESNFSSDYDIYNACTAIFKDSFPKAK